MEKATAADLSYLTMLGYHVPRVAFVTIVCALVSMASCVRTLLLYRQKRLLLARYPSSFAYKRFQASQGLAQSSLMWLGFTIAQNALNVWAAFVIVCAGKKHEGPYQKRVLLNFIFQCNVH